MQDPSFLSLSESPPPARRCPACGAGCEADAIFCASCGFKLPHEEDEAQRDPLVGTVIAERFRVVRKLGHGGMASIYEADQINVRRKVALKLLDPILSQDGQNVARFKREASAASALTHPNTITVHDFGRTEQGWMYIAIELVDGVTLKGLFTEEKPLPWRRACRIMRQVCDSLEDAHRHGVIHRDLKPDNIMVCRRGDQPDFVKVLDFGIARIVGKQDSVSLSGDGGVFGTPRYIAPEVAQGGEASALSDVYSLGAVFYRVLTGRPPFLARTAMALIREHVSAQPPAFATANPTAHVPRAVEDIIMRCLAKWPGDRPTAMKEVSALLEEALGDAPLEPSETEAWPGDDLDDPASALNRLLSRLAEQPDFPAAGAHIAELNQVVANPTTTADDLANVILKDQALTAKLLRLVNSPAYRQISGEITTVSRAVVVLGFAQVRRAALSLLMFDQLSKDAGETMKDAALGAFMSGLVARSLAADIPGADGEEAFICSLFHDLGTQLVAMHLPEEHHQIEGLRRKGSSESAASARVLGVDYEAVGRKVAELWRLPGPILDSMERLPEGVAPGATRDPKEQLRHLSCFANELKEVVRTTRVSARGDALQALARRYGSALPVDEARVATLVGEAAEQVSEVANVLSLDPQETRIGRHLQTWDDPEAADSWYPEDDASIDEPPPDLGDPAAMERGVHEVRAALEGEYDANRVLYRILDIIQRGAGLDRVLLCVHDVPARRVSARLGVGGGADDVVQHMSFAVSPATDVFNAVVKKGRDAVVLDIDQPNVRARIPLWFRERVGASAFMLLPVVVRGVTVGLIYGDTRWPHHVLTTDRVATMQTLRGLAVEAIGRKRRPPPA
jgi:serine/threonine protein kinase